MPTAKPKHTTKKKRATPPALDFRTWRVRFERSLIGRTDAAKALDRWQRSLNAMEEREPCPPWDIKYDRAMLIRMIYRDTCPQPELNEIEQQRSIHSLDALHALVTTIDGVVEGMKKPGGRAPYRCGAKTYDLSEIMKALEVMAHRIRATLMDLRDLHSQPADAIGRCFPLLYSLSHLPNKQAYALAMLALKAHGYEDDEELQEQLRAFWDPDKLRNGNVRIRFMEFREQFHSSIESAKAHWESTPELPPDFFSDFTR